MLRVWPSETKYPNMIIFYFFPTCWQSEEDYCFLLLTAHSLICGCCLQVVFKIVPYLTTLELYLNARAGITLLISYLFKHHVRSHFSVSVS